VSPRHRVSDLRILLWDIDGTLIRSVRTGGYKDYTIPVLEEIFGTSGSLGTMHVSGMTDLQIIIEALREEGFTHDDVRERIHDLSQRLTAEAKKITGNGEPFFQVLPGVHQTLKDIGRSSALPIRAAHWKHRTDGLFENGTCRTRSFLQTTGCLR
jgi:DNA-binding transcriptional MerR regulator